MLDAASMPEALPPIPAEADRALVELLASLRDRPFLLVKPGGNWGDWLIYKGMEHLAEALGLRWTSISWREIGQAQVTPEHVIYLHGSGGWNRWSSDRAPMIVDWALGSLARTVIQGPCTIENDREYADALCAHLSGAVRATGKDVHFFAREHVTHALMAPLRQAAAVHLNDDTAFYAHVPTLLRGRDRKGTYKLLALRGDPEAPPTRQGTLPGWVRFDPAQFGCSFDHWVDLHARAARIITNRTHSSIAGAILGVPTTVLDNAYHKNRSIWDYSLAPGRHLGRHRHVDAGASRRAVPRRLGAHGPQLEAQPFRPLVAGGSRWLTWTPPRRGPWCRVPSSCGPPPGPSGRAGWCGCSAC